MTSVHICVCHKTTLSKTVINIDICIQHWTVDSRSEDVQIFKYVVLGVDIFSSSPSLHKIFAVL